jgi:hypothetical protein
MIKRNDIIAYYPVSFWDRVVCYFSGKYSHVAVARDDFVEISAIYRRGLTLVPIDKCRPYDVYRLKPGIIFDEKKAWDWTKEMLGKRAKYDKLGLLAYLLKKPFLNSPSKFFCSEYNDMFFLKGGVDLRPDLENWEMGPTDITNSDCLILG